MRSYIIRKNEYKDFIMHEVFVSNTVEYCYYEKKGNSFVNKVYFVIGDFCYVGDLLDNSVYVFCSDINKLRSILSVLLEEYSNFKYEFIVLNDDLYSLVSNFININGLQGDVLLLVEYLKRCDSIIKEKDSTKNVSFNKESDYKGINQEKINNFTSDKSFADYNGFNEGLIDRNVKSIVQFKKGNGGNNGV